MLQDPLAIPVPPGIVSQVIVAIEHVRSPRIVKQSLVQGGVHHRRSIPPQRLPPGGAGIREGSLGVRAIWGIVRTDRHNLSFHPPTLPPRVRTRPSLVSSPGLGGRLALGTGTLHLFGPGEELGEPTPGRFAQSAHPLSRSPSIRSRRNPCQRSPGWRRFRFGQSHLSQPHLGQFDQRIDRGDSRHTLVRGPRLGLGKRSVQLRIERCNGFTDLRARPCLQHHPIARLPQFGLLRLGETGLQPLQSRGRPTQCAQCGVPVELRKVQHPPPAVLGVVEEPLGIQRLAQFASIGRDQVARRAGPEHSLGHPEAPGTGVGPRAEVARRTGGLPVAPHPHVPEQRLPQRDRRLLVGNHLARVADRVRFMQHAFLGGPLSPLGGPERLLPGVLAGNLLALPADLGEVQLVILHVLASRSLGIGTIFFGPAMPEDLVAGHRGRGAQPPRTSVRVGWRVLVGPGGERQQSAGEQPDCGQSRGSFHRVESYREGQVRMRIRRGGEDANTAARE